MSIVTVNVMDYGWVDIDLRNVFFENNMELYKATSGEIVTPIRNNPYFELVRRS